MVRVAFRARLLLILMLFAAIPMLVVGTVSVVAYSGVAQLLGGGAAWDKVAESGSTAIAAARAARLTPSQRAAVDSLEVQLSESATFARRLRFMVEHATPLIISALITALAILAFVAWWVAGHLTRQLSRPVHELVGWTELIARGEALPLAETRGAPEFEVLRARMRTMAEQLETGRARAVEAERLRAFRESSRRFAHELKNPLTPIRFALARLRRDAPAGASEALDVVATETERLETMARSFAQFGRLPEGPVADIDVSDMVAYTARATVPERLRLKLDVASVPPVRGHYDVLSRTLANLLLNAVDACGEAGEITVTVRATQVRNADGVRIAVRDTGHGIPAAKLEAIWEPYVTDKPGGTGLGLAIARQSVEAHGGEVFASSEPGATEIGFAVPVNAGLPAITGEWHAG
ncbi:MAG TPA: HAMP domain-containing sensor histidine kinase [Gemmatimonadaceae bacterium]|nr:HAMP domain-containing sensor histidine kinase [Gemmatimonadaceae bacterium]